MRVPVVGIGPLLAGTLLFGAFANGFNWMLLVLGKAVISPSMECSPCRSCARVRHQRSCRAAAGEPDHRGTNWEAPELVVRMSPDGGQ